MAAFHDRAWCPLDWHLRTPSQTGVSVRGPKRYDDMIAIAEGIGKDFDHLKVDVYELGGIWVGELTLYSWSGMIPFSPNEADELVGSYWSLQQPALRALKAILLRWRQIPKTT